MKNTMCVRKIQLCLVLGLMFATTAFAKSNLMSSINKVKQQHRLFDDDDPTPDFNTTTDEKFYFWNYYLKGFKSEEKMPSSTNCSTYLQQTLNQYNETTDYWADPIGGKHMYVLNVTEWISYSLAHSSRACFMSGSELYMWYQWKSSLFSGFNSWFPAFLQNLLGQIMTFKQVEEKIDEAIAEDNTEAQYYWYGRLTYMMLDFDPIDLDDDSLDDDVPLMEIMENIEQLFVQPESSPKKQLKAARETPLVNSPVVKGMGSNVYDFGYHFMNSSIGTSSPNSTICETSISNLNDAQGYFFLSMGRDQYNQSSFAFEDMLEQAYPISFSCYFSMYEFGGIGKEYVAGASNGNQLMYNMVHRLGFMTDTINLIKATPNETEIEQEYYYKQLGNYYGHLLKLIFYSPDDYDPYDPAHDMNPNDQTIIYHQ